MEDIECFVWFAKYIFLPLFISYLLAVDFLLINCMYREVIALLVNVFSLNAIFWKLKSEKEELENER